MPDLAMLDYFYGDEAEQFTFYRIPKVLFTDPSYRRISSDAKILYGLMLDRMGLSVRNGWLDDCQRVFIYFTLEDAEQFNRALAQELEKHGVILNDFYTCPHAPEEHCECRKPSPFMVTEAMKKYEIDPSQSYMFGDKKSDTECGERSGVKSFRVTSEHSLLYWANQLKNNLL